MRCLEKEKMKIYLIELRDTCLGMSSQKVNGLMLPILAVWAERSGWEAEVDFTSKEKVSYDKECDVVAISTYTFLAPSSFRIADEFRRRGKLVVIGGPHTKGCAEEAREHADAVFDRCCEETWRSFLKDVEEKRIIPSGGRGIFVPSPEMKEIPSHREIRKHYGEKKVPMLLSSLGCPNTCDFCTDWNSTYFKRSVGDVLKDVESVDSKFFAFSDPNFGAQKRHTTELLKGMVPLNKKYVMETSLAYLLKDDYLELLRDSGCLAVEIGIESFSSKYKKNAMHRADSILEDSIQKIGKIKEYIPFVQVNMVLGLDSDDEETFTSIVEFYKRSRVDSVVLHMATPFPGTPYWDRMKHENRIAVTDWEQYTAQHLVIRLSEFSDSDFYSLYINTLKALNSPFGILGKVFGHYRSHRKAATAFLLFSFLLQRARNTFFYDIPDLKRARKQAQEADLISLQNAVKGSAN